MTRNANAEANGNTHHPAPRGTTIAMLCGLSLLAACPAVLAQASGAARMPNTASNMAVSAADRSFVEEAMKGGMAEVEAGKMAQQKAANDAVKQFGARMVQNHGKAGDELKSIASSKGVGAPPMDGDHQRHLDQLSRMSGSAFDQAYMAHMLDAHRKTIALFEKEAGSGRDEQLKAFASRTLPTLREHLSMAQSVDAGMKGKSGPGPGTPSRP